MYDPRNKSVPFSAQVDQTELFPSIVDKLEVFYSGMSLAELHNLAQAVGLKRYAESPCHTSVLPGQAIV